MSITQTYVEHNKLYGGASFVGITLLADVMTWYRNGTSDYFGEAGSRFDSKPMSTTYSYFEGKCGLHPQRSRRVFVRLTDNYIKEGGSAISNQILTNSEAFEKQVIQSPTERPNKE